MSLQEKLDGFKAGFLANTPSDVRQKMTAATEDLARSGMLSDVLNEGDRLPGFSLPNQLGAEVKSSQLLAEGPMIVTFYRGGWCPYCNLELRAYQAQLGRIRGAGANLVAITPELPDESLNTAEKNELDFHVLTDENGAYADQLGLLFTVPEDIRHIYDGFGIDIEKHNGEGRFVLPLAATYVVASDGVVCRAFIDVDYTQRMEPEDAIDALQAITKAA